MGVSRIVWEADDSCKYEPLGHLSCGDATDLVSAGSFKGPCSLSDLEKEGLPLDAKGKRMAKDHLVPVRNQFKWRIPEATTRSWLGEIC